MRQTALLLLLLFTTTIPTGRSLSASSSNDATRGNSRRLFFQKIASAGASSIAVSSSPRPAFALDMDAFMNNAIQQDTPATLSDDERTCKYAAPGRERGEACARAGLPTGPKGGKKGVDAYGNIDRGTFVRCKTEYPMVNGKYEKTVVCSE